MESRRSDGASHSLAASEDGSTSSCGASAKLLMRTSLPLVDALSDGFLLFRSSSMPLSFLVGGVAIVLANLLLLIEPSELFEISPTVSAMAWSFEAANERLRGDEDAGLDGGPITGGSSLSDGLGASFGFGRGGKVIADRGREADLSLSLRLLSGRANGSSRLGGTSCSRVSGNAYAESGDVLGESGRGSVVGHEEADESLLLGSRDVEGLFAVEELLA